MAWYQLLVHACIFWDNLGILVHVGKLVHIIMSNSLPYHQKAAS